MTQTEPLLAAMIALEQQRPVLGDAVPHRNSGTT